VNHGYRKRYVIRNLVELDAKKSPTTLFKNLLTDRDAQLYNQSNTEFETGDPNELTQSVLDNTQQIILNVDLNNPIIAKWEIDQICAHGNHWFKFNVKNESDLDLIYSKYVEPMDILENRVLAILDLNTDNDLMSKSKEYGYLGLTKLYEGEWPGADVIYFCPDDSVDYNAPIDSNLDWKDGLTTLINNVYESPDGELLERPHGTGMVEIFATTIPRLEGIELYTDIIA
jgi:hypothetical protein